MMDINEEMYVELANTIIQFVAQGGGSAVILILIGVIALLVWDRKQLIKDLSNTTQKVFDAKDSETKSIKEIVERYHQGNLDLVQALNEIKIVLVTIQNGRK
jgi:hypothetical protein